MKNPDVLEEVQAQAATFDGTWEKEESIMINANQNFCGRTKGSQGRERNSWWCFK